MCKRLMWGLAVAVVLGGCALAQAQTVCPCFTTAQVDRWVLLATHAGGTLDACLAPNDSPAVRVVAVNDPHIIRLTVGVWNAQVCLVVPDDSNALAGIPFQQQQVTPAQGQACLEVLRYACGSEG